MLVNQSHSANIWSNKKNSLSLLMVEFILDCIIMIINHNTLTIRLMSQHLLSGQVHSVTDSAMNDR